MEISQDKIILIAVLIFAALGGLFVYQYMQNMNLQARLKDMEGMIERTDKEIRIIGNRNRRPVEDADEPEDKTSALDDLF